MNNQLVLEISSLKNILLQGVFQASKEVFIFELYHHLEKKLYLVVDLKQKHIHVQKEKVPFKMPRCNFLAATKKRFMGPAELTLTCGENPQLAMSKLKGWLLLFLLESRNLVIAHNDKPFMWLRPPDKNFISLPKLQALSEDFLGLSDNFQYAKQFQEGFIKSQNQALENYRKKAFLEKCKKQKRLIENLQKDYEKWSKHLQKEKLAKLLQTNIHKAKKGQDYLLCTDYETDPIAQVKVPVDPSVPLKYYVEKLFVKIKKAKRALVLIEKNLSEAKKRLAIIKANEHQASEASLSLNLHEAINQGKPKKVTRKPFKEFLSSDGIKILVGRSAKDSDEMLRKYAVGNDFWFHVKNTEGAHVVVKYQKDALPEKTFNEAMILALHFSKDKDESSGVIEHTKVKHLKKLKNAPQGTVLISKGKTAQVVMDPKILASLFLL